MNNLGLYYYKIENNYELAKKYFLMAVDKNLPEAYNNMGLYYYLIYYCLIYQKIFLCN